MSRFFTFINFLTIAVSVLAILAPFFFTWQCALGIGILAALFFPPIVILTGAFIDVLYMGSHSFPYFTIICLCIATVAYFVQRFLKTRIMS